VVYGRNTESNRTANQHSPAARRESVAESGCSLSPFGRLIASLINRGSERGPSHELKARNRVPINIYPFTER
jgi:hypothetical protein